MVHAGTGRWRQKNGRPMVIVGSRLAVYRMAVVVLTNTDHVRNGYFKGYIIIDLMLLFDIAY